MRRNAYALILCLLAIITNANAQTGHITGHNVSDTCTSTRFYVSADSVFSIAQMETSYGDGIKDTTIGTSSFNTWHSYSSPGTFTVKQVLIVGGVRIDSIVYSTNFSGCGIVKAKLYHDRNGNCIFDRGDNYLEGNATFEVDSAGKDIDTVGAWGLLYYRARGFAVPYTFKLLSVTNGFAITCPAAGIINVTTLAGGTVTPGDIGFGCSGSSDFDVAVHSVGIHTSSKECNLGIALSNTNCIAQSGTVSMTVDPKYQITKTFPAGTISGNTVTWAYSNLTADGWAFFEIYGIVPGLPLKKGDSVVTRINCPWIAGDLDTTNNSSIISDTVSGPWDPNDKEVSPKGSIAGGARLTYTLSFENTGNAPAENIHILDTLSANLEVKSIQVITSSHTVNVRVIKAGSLNILKFDFPGIHLLDSSHYGQCNGFVMFGINSKTGLVPGTKIDNQAGIYFDGNEVVMTNMVENNVATLSVPGLQMQGNVQLYPNPAAGELTIKTDKIYDNAIIINDLGQTVMQQKLQAKETHVNVKALTPGMYYIMLKNADGVRVEKIEKL